MSRDPLGDRPVVAGPLLPSTQPAGGVRRAARGPAGPSWLRVDLGLLIGAFGLSVVGVVLVWSATRASVGGTAALKQLVALGVGIACAAVVTRLDVRVVRAVAPVVYVLAVLGLAAVVSPLGSTVNGSRSWIRLPGGLPMPMPGIIHRSWCGPRAKSACCPEAVRRSGSSPARLLPRNP